MIPQMSPMKWLYISILCKLNFIMIMFIMNSIPLKLNFKYNINKLNKKWMWCW